MEKFDKGFENVVYNCDCIELMEEMVKQGIKVDLIVTDPPYNIKIAKWDKWKTIDKYVEWCARWLALCDKILKDNGSFYMWHNDFAQLSEIQHWIDKNTSLVFNSFCIWDKGEWRAQGWKNPSQSNNLRSWFNTTEFCVYYNKSTGIKTEWDRTGLDIIKKDVNNFSTLRKYAYNMLCYIGNGMPGAPKKIEKNQVVVQQNIFFCLPKCTRSNVLKELGGTVDHFTRYGSTQWELCTCQTYEKLTEIYQLKKWKGYREYESLRQEYESLRYIHNLDCRHNNVWKASPPSSKIHICQKPIQLIERIIKTSSNSNALVFDPFMGSFTTAVACHKLNRKYLGAELDKKYYELGIKRLEQTKSQISLFDL